VIKVLFFGTPYFAVPTLEKLCTTEQIRVAAVVTQPDRPAGRGSAITASPVKLCAQNHGIPVFQPTSLRKEFSTLQTELAQLGPFDVGVVIAFGQILPHEVLTFPKAGCINIHASLLPRWRGAAPIQRAIEAGDAETGVCLMQMNIGLDTGGVYSTARTPISQQDTCQTLHDRLAQMGSDLLLRDLESICRGSLVAIPQTDTEVSYAKKISSQESHIDWSQTAMMIARKVQAFSPHPACYAVWNGKRLKILKAYPTEDQTTTDQTTTDQTTIEQAAPVPAPGYVMQAESDRLTIKCGSGSLRLEEVQLEGKRRMSISEFMRGTTINAGMRFE
jgi:methionyl-tRNA formyltransferase